MLGIIGRRPAQGTTWRVLMPGKHWFTQRHQGPDAVSADVLVVAVEFGRAGNAEAVNPSGW
jgi:hypothetical protein